MPEFTKIEREDPVIIPATEEKVYDKYWISEILITSKAGGSTFISATLIPYNGSETINDPVRKIVIDDVFGAIQDPSRPEALRMLLAQTMESFFLVVKGEISYQDSK